MPASLSVGGRYVGFTQALILQVGLGYQGPSELRNLVRQGEESRWIGWSRLFNGEREGKFKVCGLKCLFFAISEPQ